MGKTLIKIDCLDQRLIIASAPILASGGKNEDEIEFNFCSLWDKFDKTAVFYRDPSDVYHATIVENRCTIPHEVLKESGWMHFGVFGVNETTTRTSEVLKYRVADGAITEGTKPSDPTPDIYEQILQSIALTKNRLDQRMSVVENQIASIITLPDGETTVEDIKLNVINAAKFHNPYGDTPFYSITYPQTETLLRYYSDGQSQQLTRCTPVMPCPKYLGFRLLGNSRMYLYIGDLDENGAFTVDPDYIFGTTTQGVINYLNSSHNRIVEVEAGKYFYYKVYIDEGYEIVGCDVMPETVLDINAHTPYGTTTTLDVIANRVGCDSIYLPNGCYYAIFTDNVPADYKRENLTLYATIETGSNDKLIFETLGVASFGYIEGDMATLLQLPDTCYPENYRLCVWPSGLHSTCKSGPQRRASQLASKIVRDFRFKAMKELLWSNSSRKMYTDKRYFGIPYASRWRNSHYVGFEISPETALNALADPHSIAYDDGSISGASEINEVGGTGYGLVCSSFMCLIFGCKYPQSNRGFTFDDNFSVSLTNHVASGMILSNKALDHCVQVDEMFDSGFTVYEAISPCCAKTVRTGRGNYISDIKSKTNENYLDNFPYAVNFFDRSGYDENFLNFDGIEIANGSVRPWRGNKCVYGPWDKSSSGSGIGVTIHDGASTIYLKKPGSETLVSIAVPAGAQYVDISEHVTVDGTYELHSNVSDVHEYFRYYNHDTVKLSFDADGVAHFDSDDVMYVYTNVYGHGDNYPGVDDELGFGPVVIAAGKRYKAIAENPELIRTVYAAIVRDPDENPWGRYSVSCTI